MLRGPSDVGCAHCAQLAADRACPICTRMICPACAADWTTCDQPSGRVVRLGVGGRVRSVDPSGTFALVMQFARAPRVIDLRSFAILPRTLPRFMHTARLTRDDRLVYFEEPLDPQVFRGIVERKLRTGQERTIFNDPARRPQRGARVTATGDTYYFISETQEVILIDASGKTDAIEPLPKRALQAVHVDATNGLVAAASWSEVALHRLGTGRISHLSTVKEGDVAWIALGGGRLAVAVRRGAGAHVEVRSVGSAGIGRLERELSFDRFDAAALSLDGRHLAIASEALVVTDLDTGDTQTFEEHTDTISVVAFGADDHRLISCDDDGRLIVRPRTAHGYVRPLVEVDVQAAGSAVDERAPCTHCETTGTTSMCIVCKLPVCATCSGEWTTCREPAGIAVRLGMSARVRDVDRAGRIATVTHWRKAPRRFDVRHLTFLSGAPVEEPRAQTAITDDLKLRVVWRDGRTQLLDLAPRQSLLAHAVDGARGIVAAAAWGRIVVHDGTREIGSYRVEGAAHFIGLAAGRVVAVANDMLYAWYDDVEVRMIDVFGTLGAVSPDGRYVALASGSVLDVFDLDRSNRRRLPGHTDEINLVRFAEDGMLISADTDNRLILRPRGEAGYTSDPPIAVF